MKDRTWTIRHEVDGLIDVSAVDASTKDEAIEKLSAYCERVGLRVGRILLVY
ncbi:hypothetical protein [Paraburkholderia sp. J11-2]|uniref:hypothetical protein n=1 Tax=Paraburkholderia sp. J11-2 TaxID=2805431 RepID=UPI002AB7D1EA|nr:hypothetical protein [Paraburkholderia sp. J11-2]